MSQLLQPVCNDALVAIMRAERFASSLSLGPGGESRWPLGAVFAEVFTRGGRGAAAVFAVDLHKGKSARPLSTASTPLRKRTVFRVGEHEPIVSNDAWVAPDATVAGRVTLVDASSVWFGAVLRAEHGHMIRLGAMSAVREKAVLTTVPSLASGFPPDVKIGNYAQVGEGATLISCDVGHFAQIGAGATVLEGAVVEDHAVVAPNAVVGARAAREEGRAVGGQPRRVRARARGGRGESLPPPLLSPPPLPSCAPGAREREGRPPPKVPNLFRRLRGRLFRRRRSTPNPRVPTHCTRRPRSTRTSSCRITAPHSVSSRDHAGHVPFQAAGRTRRWRQIRGTRRRSPPARSGAGVRAGVRQYPRRHRLTSKSG